jgi:tRNA(Met) cytidine acetyltransferase
LYDESALLKELLRAAELRKHRATLVCDVARFGPVENFLHALGKGYYLFHGKRTIKTQQCITPLTFAAYHQLLGDTTDFVVFDSTMFYDANALSASADCVRGGGLFVLLVDQNLRPRYPQITETASQSVVIDRFKSQVLSTDLYGCFSSSSTTFVAREPSVQYRPLEGRFKTVDQLNAFQEIVKWLVEPKERVFVLLSRRGRGKSTVVGMALADLIHSGRLKNVVYVTSAQDSHTHTLKKHLLLDLAEEVTEASGSNKNYAEFSAHGSKIVFAPPQNIPDDSLLIVDDASTLSFGLLEHLIEKSNAVLLSTTTYGYEGSGKSFQTKLFRELRKLGRGFKKFEIYEPIRYAPGDPLEKALSETFFYDAEIDDRMGPHQFLASFDTKIYSNSQLSGLDVSSLRELYTVLTEAHYRNEPRDLSYMLEDVNSTTFCLPIDRRVVAVARVVKDGPLDKHKTEASLRGASFPGNLITERLAVRTGKPCVAELKGVRIARIAVRPALQGCGYGSLLIREVEGWARGKLFDWVGASFSAQPEVVNFWFKNGYTLTGLSWTQEPFSNYPSLICFKPVSQKAREWLRSSFNALQELVLSHLPLKLADERVNAMVVKSLSQEGRVEAADFERLSNFVRWNLPCELILPELRRNLFVLASHMGLTEISSATALLSGETSPSLKKSLRRGLGKAMNSLYYQ